MTKATSAARLGLAGVFGVAAALATAHVAADGDVYRHMLLGRAVLAVGRRTFADPMAIPLLARPIVATSWGWDVATYLTHRAGGFGLLAAIGAGLAIATAALLFRVVRLAEASETVGSATVAMGLGIAAAMQGATLNPEAATLPIALGFVLLCAAFAASASTSTRLGVGIVAAAVLWAQLSETFVIAPVVFAIVALPSAWGAVAPEARRPHLLVLAALVATLMTGPEGIDVVGRLFHGASSADAARHVADEAPLSFVALSPMMVFERPAGPLLVATCGVGLAGMLLGRRRWWRELALTILGAFVASSANKYVALGTLLAVPLAARSAVEIGASMRRPAITRWLGIAGGVAIVALGLWRADAAFGPLGRLQPADDAQPTKAAAWLKTAPEGARVLASADASAYLAFTLGNRVRTYVDTATPRHFEALDAGLYRDALAVPVALDRLARRYGFDVIVQDRAAPTCARPPAGFVAVAIDATQTTFARGGAGFKALETCGRGAFRPGACGDVAALDAEIARLAALGNDAFTRYLRASRVAVCGGDVERAKRELPRRRDSRPFLGPRDATAVGLMLRAGQNEAALKLAELSVSDGNLDALAVIGPLLDSGTVAPARVVKLLALVVGRQDDDALPTLRGALARACAAERDVRCARLHAVRAMIGGSPAVAPVVGWIAEAAPGAEQRDDAKAWLTSRPPREDAGAADIAQPDAGEAEP